MIISIPTNVFDVDEKEILFTFYSYPILEISIFF